MENSNTFPDEFGTMATNIGLSNGQMATKTYEQWMMAFGKARLDWKRWTETRTVIAELQYAESEQNENFERTIKQFRAEDKLIWREIAQTKELLEKSTGSSLEAEIQRIFKIVFKKMRSRNQDLGVDIGGQKLCAGPGGFSLRRRIQAQEIGHRDMWDIIKKSTEVSNALRKHGMSEFADKMDIFSKIVPNIKEVKEINIPVDKILVPPEQQRVYGESQAPRVYDGLPRIASNIRFDRAMDDNDVTISLVMDEEAVVKSEVYSENVVSVSLDRWTKESSLFVYYQLHRQMNEVLKKYKQSVQPIIDDATTALEKLNKEFGKELLLHTL